MDMILADNDTFDFFDVILNQLVPIMASNVLNRESFGWVSVQNAL
jgi:hypothetical protein